MAVVAQFRNEARYIREWLLFHRAVGFDFFILYDNGSDDDTAARALEAGSGDVRVIDWNHFASGVSTQVLAYNHAAANYGGECAWMCFIDIDEFVFPLQAQPIGEVLEAYTDIPSIAVPWHMYGTSGHGTPPEGGVIANFQRRAPFPPTEGEAKWMLNYKSIFQPQYLARAHIHTPFMWREPAFLHNARKERVLRSRKQDARFACSEVFRLNHYYTRDAQTLQEKVTKGRGTGAGRAEAKRRMMIERVRILEQASVHDPVAAARVSTVIDGDISTR